MSSSIQLWALFGVCMALVAITGNRVKLTQAMGLHARGIGLGKISYIVATVLMILFIGLRIWCNDTGTYREIYDYLTPVEGNLLGGIDWSIGESPLFILSNRIIKRCGASTQSYLMLFALITVAIYMWFVYKYSSDIWLSVFLVWTMGVYLFAAAGMRQAVAIAIGLLGIDRFLQAKKARFIVWVVIAAFFHPYAALFLLAPIMVYPPWSHRTGWMLGIFFAVGISLQSLMGTILSLTALMGKEYESDAFSGEGVNVFRLLVTWAPIALSFIARKGMRQSYDKANNLFVNFSMLNASIMFVALFGTANYFARLANYFLIFQTLALPWLFRYYNERSRKLLKVLVVFCYLLYFIFANVILTPFDSYFAKMTLWEYLSTLF